MKLPTIGSLLVGLLAACTQGTAPKAVPSPEVSPVHSPQTPPSPSPVADSGRWRPPPRLLAFVDASTGWAGIGGKILATTDGGRSWVETFSAPDGIRWLDFADVMHGWALVLDSEHRPGTLLRTVDGRTWSKLEGPATPLVSIDFVSAHHGYGIQTDGFVVRTSDGGATWEQVTALDPADSLCADGTAVWATQGRVAYRLIGDEGARGVFAAPLPGDGWVGEIGCAGGTAWMLLQAGGAMSKQSYAVFRTLDGGSTWDPVIAQFLHAGTYYPFGDVKRTIDAYSGPFAAVDERTAQFVGSCPACDLGTVSLLTTPDGGKSWRRRHVFDGGLPVGASFPDRMHGWVLVSIGAEGRTVLIATTDGGASWRPQFETVTD